MVLQGRCRLATHKACGPRKGAASRLEGAPDGRWDSSYPERCISYIHMCTESERERERAIEVVCVKRTREARPTGYMPELLDAKRRSQKLDTWTWDYVFVASSPSIIDCEMVRDDLPIFWLLLQVDLKWTPTARSSTPNSA